MRGSGYKNYRGEIAKLRAPLAIRIRANMLPELPLEKGENAFIVRNSSSAKMAREP